MVRSLVAACLAIAVTAAVADAQSRGGPTYQRHTTQRPVQGGPSNYPRRPHPQRFTAPAVQAGSIQRPYPYHLDYYRKQYQGGYEPYFGNLYGPPAIVGTQPFAFSNYPEQSYQPPVQAQQPTPYFPCPHCQQPIPQPTLQATPQAWVTPPAPASPTPPGN